MKIVNNNAPEALVKLAEEWGAKGKSFYLGPENIFFYNNQPVNYNGADKVSRNIGDWSIHTIDCSVPKFYSLEKKDIEDIAYAFIQKCPHPRLAMLTLSYKCNAACHCCPYHGDNSSRYRENFKNDINVVDFDTAKRWIDKISNLGGVEDILIGSDGEFFLIPYWKEIMAYASAKGFKQVITTNGSLITQEVIKKLVNFGMYLMKFSLHAMDFETWSAFTQIKNRKLYENAMSAPILAKKAGMTVLLNFVKTEINAHQVKDFIDYWYDKVDGIHISHALNFEDTHNNYYDQFNEPVGICEGYANMIYVMPSGTVVPCCPATAHYDDSNKHSLPYANINEHSAEEILFMMRESLKNEKFRNMCAHCVQYARRGYMPFKRQVYGYDALQTSLSLFITKDTGKKKNIFKRWKRSVLKRIDGIRYNG